LKVRRLRPKILGVRYLLRPGDMSKTGLRMRAERLAKTNISILRRYVVERDVTKCFSIVQAQRAELGVAEPCCVGQHSIENRLQLAGRACDDAQHIRGRSLLLKRLPQLVEQPRVLDRDRGLVGKGLHQGDLLLREGLHLTAPNGDDSNKIRLPKKRGGQHSAGPLVLKDHGREARLDGHIRNVHCPALQGRQPRRSLPSRRDPQTHELLGKFWRTITGCLSYENASVISTEQREVALAQARCVGEDNVEHGSK